MWARSLRAAQPRCGPSADLRRSLSDGRSASSASRNVVTTARPPWQNLYGERLIGSLRRECLDHVIVFDEMHFRRILARYFQYYQRARCHLSLAGDAPEARATHGPELGSVVEHPRRVGFAMATSGMRHDGSSAWGRHSPSQRTAFAFREGDRVFANHSGTVFRCQLDEDDRPPPHGRSIGRRKLAHSRPCGPTLGPTGTGGRLTRPEHARRQAPLEPWRAAASPGGSRRTGQADAVCCAARSRDSCSTALPTVLK
jgi:hypothetical protein